MRRTRVWVLSALGLAVIVSVVGSSLFLLPTTQLFRQSGLAKSVSSEPSALIASTSTASANLTLAPAPQATATSAQAAANATATVLGKTEPATIATPDPSATPQPTTASLLQHGMLTASNGISIGCQPGLITQYLTCTAQEPSGLSLTFYFFQPKGYTEETNYPLVLILSGGGERAIAKNPAWLNRVGVVANPYAEVFGPGYPGQYSEDVQGRWPSFIVIPQLVNPARYVDVPANKGSYTLAAQPNDSMRMAKEIVDTLQLIYHNIDANRLYVTGLSMGGYGAWEAAERWPNYWAAAAPIAGGSDPSKAARLVNLPIWAFHSADDPVVPVSGSRDMIQAIKAAGGNPKYTEYADLGHGSWLAPYTIMGVPSPTVDFFSWLFAQHK